MAYRDRSQGFGFSYLLPKPKQDPEIQGEDVKTLKESLKRLNKLKNKLDDFLKKDLKKQIPSKKKTVTRKKK